MASLGEPCFTIPRPERRTWAKLAIAVVLSPVWLPVAAVLGPWAAAFWLIVAAGEAACWVLGWGPPNALPSGAYDALDRWFPAPVEAGATPPPELPVDLHSHWHNATKEAREAWRLANGLSE